MQFSVLKPHKLVNVVGVFTCFKLALWAKTTTQINNQFCKTKANALRVYGFFILFNFFYF